VGRPAVSKHLRVLSNAGLIEHRSVGTRNLYLLAPGGMAIAQRWLVQTWDTALAAYATEVSQAAVARPGHGSQQAPPHGETTKERP
jgi:hypothetical protein